MSKNELISLIVSVITVGFMLSYLKQLISELKRKRQKGETIEDRVDKLTRSLKEATGLIDEVESEIRSRSAMADKLANDIKSYKELAEIKKKEIETIFQFVRGELRTESRKSFWVGFRINFIFFVLGVAATIIITLIKK